MGQGPSGFCRAVARGRSSAGNKVKEEGAVKRILFGCVLMVMCSQAHAGEVVPVDVPRGSGVSAGHHGNAPRGGTERRPQDALALVGGEGVEFTGASERDEAVDPLPDQAIHERLERPDVERAV